VPAAQLAELLDHDIEAPTEPRRFGAADRGWPVGVVSVGRQALNTHFGRHEAEVLEICRPYRAERIVEYLWRNLGGHFRRGFLDWLLALPDHASDRVCSAAAVTAGALFMIEPITAERELLRPWALDGRWAQRACAGLALGVPVVFRGDPAPARKLAYAWVTSDNLHYRRAAVSAYGGLLGAWDSGAAGPAYLWRIAGETPQVRALADACLASLVAFGGEAGHARATVISLLCSEAEQKPAVRRSYELLPLVFECLTAGAPAARESLHALMGDPERDSLSKLAGLLARAFDSPRGQASARSTLRILLEGLSLGRIDHIVVNRLIREMKTAAGSSRLSALGTQLERALNAERRGDGPRSAAARSVHATFFRTSMKEQ